MAEMKQVKSDVSYVREILQVSERDQGPVAIYYLWAALVLVGFPLVDFAPGYVVGLYWAIAAPLGFVISAFLGWRDSQRRGQVRRDVGIRYGLHWLGMMVAIFSAAALGATGAIAQQEVGRVILLIITLAYFLSGVHLDRPMLWVGLLMMAGYLALFFIPAYVWTILGILVAVALTITGLIERRKNVLSPS